MKRSCLLGFTIFATALSSDAITVGQIDTFEDGTAQNWTVGDPDAHPFPPTNIASSGPGGADDNYLLLRSIGGLAGAGSRLSTFNLDQWAGDYPAAGVGAIEMDVNNLGPDDVHLRLLFADPLGGPPSNIAFSADAIIVPEGSGWTHVVFPIAAADLLPGLGSVDSALSGATELRLYHRIDDLPVTPFATPPVTTELGVDNIEAVAGVSVPEAGATGWMLLGSASVFLFRRRGLVR